MGAACSRKRDQLDNVDGFDRGVSGRYCKSGSSKWLATTFSRPVLEIQREKEKCPSLLELCTYKIREVLILFIACFESLLPVPELIF